MIYILIKEIVSTDLSTSLVTFWPRPRVRVCEESMNSKDMEISLIVDIVLIITNVADDQVHGSGDADI